MALSLFAVSGFFYITKGDVRIGLVVTFTIVFFTFFYSIGAGPIPFTLSAEVFPLCVRGMHMHPSLATLGRVETDLPQRLEWALASWSILFSSDSWCYLFRAWLESSVIIKSVENMGIPVRGREIFWYSSRKSVTYLLWAFINKFLGALTSWLWHWYFSSWVMQA